MPPRRRILNDPVFRDIRDALRRDICASGPLADVDFVPRSHLKGLDRLLPVPGARATLDWPTFGPNTYT